MTASEVLPNPAGALITVRRLLAARSARPASRGRIIKSTGRRGETIFVARKRCSPLADVSLTTRIFQSHIVIGGGRACRHPPTIEEHPPYWGMVGISSVRGMVDRAAPGDHACTALRSKRSPDKGQRACRLLPSDSLALRRERVIFRHIIRRIESHCRVSGGNRSRRSRNS